MIRAASDHGLIQGPYGMLSVLPVDASTQQQSAVPTLQVTLSAAATAAVGVPQQRLSSSTNGVRRIPRGEVWCSTHTLTLFLLPVPLTG